MFNFVHEKKKVVQIVLMLIILPFAFWGMDSYNKSSPSEALAVVNGEKISQLEFDQAWRQQQSRMREMMGSSYDQAMFDRPEVKRSALENLVNQRLLVQQAHAAGLRVNDQQLSQTIVGIESFQQGGKFDKQLYERTLKSQGMSPLIFEERVAQELRMRQLTDAYMQNGYAAQVVIDNLVRLSEQQRTVAMAKIELDPFLKQAKVDKLAVQTYYEANQQEFQTSEQVRVEYVVFSAEDLQSKVVVGDTEINMYYDEHQSEFGEQEQRQAAHILITVTAQASAADIAAAKAKAEQILQQAKLSPKKFAELARQHSQDPGSAANGGDLGMFGRGAMVKPFEDATFTLKPGEISGLVQSDFGFHIIKLLAVKGAKIQPLSEARIAIKQRLQMQRANDKFAELAEKFSNMVYEQSDTLKPAAELTGVSVQQSPWLTKGQAGMPPWTGKALQGVFSEDVLKNKRNSAAVEVAPNTLLAARLLEHKSASVRPLAEVSESIRKKLLHQQALELAIKQGRMVLSQLQRGEKVNLKWEKAVTVTREKHAGLDDGLARQVFQVNTSKLPAYIAVESAQGGYTIARVEAIKDIATVDESSRTKYSQQMRQLTGDELFQAYLADTKKHADIKIPAFSVNEKK